MYLKSIQELLNLKNNGVLPDEDAEWDDVYGLKISIDFKLQTLNDEEFQEVCNFIEKHSDILRELYLPEININVLGCMNRLQVLSNSICKCKTLESLDLYGLIIEKLNPQYLQEIINIFSECQNLKLLNLSWFPFSELKIKNMQDICETIAKLPKFQKLNLFSTDFDKLTTDCFRLLCSTIEKCPQLQWLTLYQKELDHLKPKHFAILCETIYKSKTIMYCNIEGVQPDYNKERWNTIKEILKKKQSLLELTDKKESLLLISIESKTIDDTANMPKHTSKKEILFVSQQSKLKRDRTTFKHDENEHKIKKRRCLKRLILG